MKEYIGENNNVLLIGKTITDFVFNHKIHGEGFYSFYLEINRLSSNADKIPVLISERLIGEKLIEKDTYIRVDGQFRSYNNYSDKGNKLILTVFAKSINILDEIDNLKMINQISLNGFICKKPIFRTTPFGREISDILVAVNRSYNKSDYVPCIAWGRNARFANELEVGDNLKIFGRIQSREYEKKYDSGEIISKTAYEVSISKLELEEKLVEESQSIEKT